MSFVDPARPPVRSTEFDWPAVRVAWTSVLLLCLAAIISQVDRVIINLLIEPIKHDMRISDTSFGLLLGTAFGLFYTLFALPIARLADSKERRTVIVVGVFFFSLFSVGSGAARTYWQLFLTRVGVGVGEASVHPAAYSTIADSFPPERLGRAISVFMMSSFVGTGLAFVAGGSLIGLLVRLGPQTLPVLGTLQSWNLAFLIVGLVGLLLVPVLLFLREPRRRGNIGGMPVRLPVREVARQLGAARKALVPMFAAMSMVTLITYSWSIWTPALFIRLFGWSAAEIGLWYGLVMLIAGPAGAFAAGWLTDRLTQRGMVDAPVKVAGFGFVGCALFGGLAPMMPSPWLALTLIAPTIFLSTMPYSAFGTALQLITPGNVRGQASALYITVVNIVGLGIGPILIGLFNDHLFTGPKDIRYSLMLVNVVAGPAMLALMLVAARPYRALRQAAVENDTDRLFDKAKLDGR